MGLDTSPPQIRTFVIDPVSLLDYPSVAFERYVQVLQVLCYDKLGEDFTGQSSQIDRLELCITFLEIITITRALDAGDIHLNDFVKTSLVYPQTAHQWLQLLDSKSLAVDEVPQLVVSGNGLLPASRTVEQFISEHGGSEITEHILMCEVSGTSSVYGCSQLNSKVKASALLAIKRHPLMGELGRAKTVTCALTEFNEFGKRLGIKSSLIASYQYRWLSRPGSLSPDIVKLFSYNFSASGLLTKDNISHWRIIPNSLHSGHSLQSVRYHLAPFPDSRWIRSSSPRRYCASASSLVADPHQLTAGEVATTKVRDSIWGAITWLCQLSVLLPLCVFLLGIFLGVLITDGSSDVLYIKG